MAEVIKAPANAAIVSRNNFLAVLYGKPDKPTYYTSVLAELAQFAFQQAHHLVGRAVYRLVNGECLVTYR